MENGLAFSKMHGAGNDFVVIDDMSENLELDALRIERLCSRRRGIGADGLIILRPGGSCDFRMVYYNSDGGEADMCGNGARCAARFAFDRGIAGASMDILTGAGVVPASVIAGGPVRVGIGPVRRVRLGIAIPETGDEAGFADSGVPHAAVFTEDRSTLETPEFVDKARLVRNSAVFAPGGANVNSVMVTSPHRLSYRTYERGVEDETEACGTGAAACAVIAAFMGLVSPPVECLAGGGDTLTVGFEIEDDGVSRCTLTGPAVEVFRGELTDPLS